MLGFDAIGRLALGQIGGGQNVTLSASAGSFAVSGGGAATFRVGLAPVIGSFSVSGVSALFSVQQASAFGTYSFVGVTANFGIREIAGVGLIVVTGQGSNEPIIELAQGGSFSVRTIPAALIRTGDDYELNLGGVGHFLEEIERQKRLNAITRKIPGPVDRRTVPRFEPLRGPPSAPAAAPPAIAAMPPQRMADVAAQAKTAKRRKDEEAILLLAS